METQTTVQTRGQQQGVTFRVHEVQPETPVLPQVSLSDSLRACLKSGADFVPELLAVSHEEGTYLQMPSQNGLLAAVHLAFSKHLPLSLSPDMIWLAILQGFTRHVKVHATELEGRLMNQPGKHVIRVVVHQLDWPVVFEKFATALEQHTGPQIREWQSDFSTTGPVERTASQIALMDVFSPYVQYLCVCLCGIPSITLQGCEGDWVRLREKLARLRGYEADEWIAELDEILAQFVEACRGNVDRAWWQQIYKLKPRYGGEDIEGWLGAFFPYLRHEDQTFTRPRVRGQSFTTDIVPPGISEVGLKLVSPIGSETLRLISGFVGVEDLGAEGVAPKIGWAVVGSSFIEKLVASWDAHPGIQVRPARSGQKKSPEGWAEIRGSQESLPIELQLFYRATDGAGLYGKGEIYPVETLIGAPSFRYWHHLGRWCDGSLLLVGVSTTSSVVRLRWDGDAWEYQVLAASFGDFMARLVAADGAEFWREESFREPELEPRWAGFEPPVPGDENFVEAFKQLRRQNARLRSMKVLTHDLFTIHLANGENLAALPVPLRKFYYECNGVEQNGGFTIWPAAQVAAVPGTDGRWYEIGSAPGYRIIFDGAADRGVAVIAEKERAVYGVARSLSGFLLSGAEKPQTQFWVKEEGLLRERSLWPDEVVELSEQQDAGATFNFDAP